VSKKSDRIRSECPIIEDIEEELMVEVHVDDDGGFFEAEMDMEAYTIEGSGDTANEAVENMLEEALANYKHTVSTIEGLLSKMRANAGVAAEAKDD